MDRPRGIVAGRMECQRETYSIAENDLGRLDDGRMITVRPDRWLRGQVGGVGEGTPVCKCFRPSSEG